MRLIRMAFVILFTVILVGIALANRDTVVLNLFPAQFGAYLGGGWSLRLPLFLVIFVAIAFGMVVGMVWEWLREAGIRAEVGRKSAEVDRLEREVVQYRKDTAVPKDEVLAILDAPKPLPDQAALPKT